MVNSKTKTCIYCGADKPEEEFSDEHIWPNALGGNFLSPFWRTDDVCGKCNNTYGVFVDGALIKSFFGSAERAHDALDYLDPNKPTGILSLNYMGTIDDDAIPAGEVADFWLCAPGANIVHFRKKSEEDTWNAYAGGDPRRQSKQSKAERVLVGLTSPEPYWIITALLSVKHHFARASKFVTNLEIPPNGNHFSEINPENSQQLADLQFFNKITTVSLRGEYLQCKITIALGADSRFLAKLALAVGYKLFGTKFLQTPYGLDLRKALREANYEKRRQIPIYGSGYLTSFDLGDIEEKLRWPGGWVLLLMALPNALLLTVQPPSGRCMVIKVTDDPELLAKLEPKYLSGVAWLTIPAAARALGPFAYPDFVAHQIGQQTHPELLELAALRGQRDRLPPTGIPASENPEAGVSLLKP